MKERPILFSGEMVKAILEGRKTQTRRIVQQPRRKDGVKLLPELLADIGAGHACPYGVIGDRLWVRESWALDGGKTIYMADLSRSRQAWVKWKPSIHMRREYSRINLEITGVRVERVQSISAADCIAEGAITDEWREWREDVFNVAPQGSTVEDERGPFSRLWDRVNKDRGYGWDVNPWVWVIEFKAVKQ